MIMWELKWAHVKIDLFTEEDLIKKDPFAVIGKRMRKKTYARLLVVLIVLRETQSKQSTAIQSKYCKNANKGRGSYLVNQAPFQAALSDCSKT